jgi:hypothetical protein
LLGFDTSTTVPEEKQTTLPGPLETTQQGKETKLPLFVGGAMGGVIILLLLLLAVVLIIAVLVVRRTARKTAKDITSDSRSTSNHLVSFNG